MWYEVDEQGKVVEEFQSIGEVMEEKREGLSMVNVLNSVVYSYVFESGSRIKHHFICREDMLEKVSR